MRTIPFIFAAGERKELDITADFFYLRETQYPVDIVLQKSRQPASERAVGVEAGYNDKPLLGFDKIIIESAQAQSIKVDISSGQSGYDRNVSTIIGNLLGITNPVTMVDKGDSYGASYRSITGLAANTADAVFSAAANVNGAIIHAAAFASGNGSTIPNSCFLAKVSAPASVTDGDAILTADNINTANSAAGRLQNPIKIPAGKGLYFISNVAESIGNRGVLYTLL